MKKALSKLLIMICSLYWLIFEKVVGEEFGNYEWGVSDGSQSFYGVYPLDYNVQLQGLYGVPRPDPIIVTFDFALKYILPLLVIIIGIIQFIRQKKAKTLNIKKLFLKFGAMLLGCGILYVIYKFILWYFEI